MEPAYQDLINDIKNYLAIRYKIGKLDVLEKLSMVIAIVIAILVAVILVTIALTYFSVALVYLLIELTGSVIPALCIMGACFLAVTAIILLFRKQLIINPTIKILSRIIFSDNNDEDISTIVKNKE